MDLTRLTQGEKIAGVSGIALILIMFIFKWFGLKAGVGGFSVEGSRNAWGSYGFIDLVLFITVVAAVGLAALKASESEVGLPVAASAIVAAQRGAIVAASGRAASREERLNGDGRPGAAVASSADRPAGGRPVRPSR